MSRALKIAVAAVALGCAGAAQATTIVIFVEPMTMEKHTRVFDTPGPDRVFVCGQPPSMAGCTEVDVKKRR